jgi:hypothetical protein
MKRRLKDVTPHDLRASHASWVADKHGIMAAARRLGHANASVTTRHYARAVEGRDDEIADAFDTDRNAKRHGTRNEDRGGVARKWHEDGDDPSAGSPVVV